VPERAPSNRRATADRVARLAQVSRVAVSRADPRPRARALVRLILRRLKEADAPAMQETVPTSLVVRGTVG